MICPYCESQNPDDASVCSSCNATLNEGAQPADMPSTGAQPTSSVPSNVPPTGAQPADMSSTGAPPTDAPPAAAYPAGMPPADACPQGTPPAPATNGANAPKKNRTKMILLIALGAVALIAIVIALVAFVTCSANGGKPNINRLLTDEPEKVSKYLENLEIIKLYSNAYYTPEDMKDTVKKANAAFDNGSRGDAKKVAEDVEKMKPWAIALFGKGDVDKDGYVELNSLKLVNIDKQANPCTATCLTYRVLDDPTPEEILKIAQEFTTIDEITFGTDPTREGERFYGENIYYVGVGKGPDADVRIRVDKLDDMYELMINVYSTDELKGEKLKTIEEFNDKFDTNFGGKVTLPKKG